MMAIQMLEVAREDGPLVSKLPQKYSVVCTLSHVNPFGREAGLEDQLASLTDHVTLRHLGT
jgi:hypothetical protein